MAAALRIGSLIAVMYAILVLARAKSAVSAVDEVGIRLLIATGFFVWAEILEALKKNGADCKARQKPASDIIMEEGTVTMRGGTFWRRHKHCTSAYCGICGFLSESPLNDLLIGRRFICPKWQSTSPHFGAVIRRKERGMRCWLHVQSWLICYSTRCSFAAFLRCIFCLSPGFVLIIWLVLLSIFLRLLTPHSGLLSWSALVACYHILDSLLSNTSIALVIQQPRLPLRSVILGGFAFFELSLAFAIFYLLLPEGAMHPPLWDGLTAWYFSLVTIVTLGYGDIHPCLPLVLLCQS